MTALRGAALAALLLLSSLLSVGLTTPADAQAHQGDAELLKLLRAGGMVVVMRHAPADPNRADTDPLNFKNIKAQQPLTEQGRQTARTLGETWRRLDISFSEILTSRFNRALQTAVLAGYKTAKPVTELTEGSLVTSPNEQRRRVEYLKKLTATPPAPGRNRLIVTHRANIVQAFGKEWFDVKEGEASLFQVENGAYTLVARLLPGDWSRLTLVAQRN